MSFRSTITIPPGVAYARIRTREEIDRERYALKVLAGDFAGIVIDVSGTERILARVSDFLEEIEFGEITESWRRRFSGSVRLTCAVHYKRYSPHSDPTRGAFAAMADWFEIVLLGLPRARRESDTKTLWQTNTPQNGTLS